MLRHSGHACDILTFFFPPFSLFLFSLLYHFFRFVTTLSSKIILAWLLKHCLDEFKNEPIQKIAENYIEGEPEIGNIPTG